MLGRRRTLLLTGASRGIGHAAVKKFSAEGWRVLDGVAASVRRALSVGRRRGKSRAARPAGYRVPCRISPRSLKDKTDGYLDALINNAAISPKAESGKRMDSLHTRYQDWLAVFNVNFFSIALLAQALRSELIAARGTVINITSIAGSRVHPFAGSAYAFVEGGAGRTRRGNWRMISAIPACASMRWPRARSKPRSCRPAPKIL